MTVPGGASTTSASEPSRASPTRSAATSKSESPTRCNSGHAAIQDRPIQIDDGFAVGMQNMGMNGRVLKTVNPDGEFASLVNHAYGLSYGENYSLVQENSHKYMEKPTLPDGQHNYFESTEICLDAVVQFLTEPCETCRRMKLVRGRRNAERSYK